jgi:hypothetical protein
MLMTRITSWRAKQRRFPIRWLTYKQRVRDDIGRLYLTEKGRAFFDDKFISALSSSAKQLEDWEIKLLLSQVGISAFILMGFVSTEVSISIFGVSLKQAAGLKELLLALSATVSVATYAVSQSKILKLIVIDKLTELRTDPEFIAFAKLAAPASYQMNMYIAKQYDKWIFSTPLTKSVTFVLTTLFVSFFLLMLGFSVGLWVCLFYEILRAPSVGIWSYFALAYCSVAYALCILWLMRAGVPLPFRDMHALQQLKALEGDPVVYAAKLREIYN